MIGSKREGRYVITTGEDESGRIYADIVRNGRHWRRVTSDGFSEFKHPDEAKRYAREVIRRG